MLKNCSSPLRETSGREILSSTSNWDVDALTGILLALNEQYDSAERRFEQAVLPRLVTKPEGLDARLQGILVGPFDKKGSLHQAQMFKKLADETLELARAWL